MTFCGNRVILTVEPERSEKMTTEELERCLAAAVCDRDLTEQEIPSIALYVDQILSLITEKNVDAAPRYRERELTKTMINNYSKDGLISPIEGKKYSKEHIVEILLVYALKSTLSIGEIKRILTGVREEDGLSGADLTDAYRRFLSCKEKNRTRAGETVRSLLETDALDVADNKAFFVALLDILSLSAYLKAAAQELLEARYADPDLAEKEKKEREKAEKREREEREKSEKLARKEEKAKNKKPEKAVDVSGENAVGEAVL